MKTQTPRRRPPVPAQTQAHQVAPRMGRMRMFQAVSAASASAATPDGDAPSPAPEVASAPSSDGGSDSERAPLLRNPNSRNFSNNFYNNNNNHTNNNNNKNIDNLDEPPPPDWRERLAFRLERSAAARWWDVADAAVNAAFAATYIAMTLSSTGAREQPEPPPLPPWLLIAADAAAAAALLAIMAPRVFISPHPWRALASSIGLFTLLTTLPTIAMFLADSLLSPQTRSTSINSPLFATRRALLQDPVAVVIYPLRFWRLHLAITRCLRPGQNAIIRLSPVAHKGISLGLSILDTLVIVTACVHVCLHVYQRCYDLSFFDVFYTIAVSSTSGLSTQIVPDNVFSRIITLYVMVVGAIFIPTNLSELIVLIRSQSKYTRRFRPDKPPPTLSPPSIFHSIWKSILKCIGFKSAPAASAAQPHLLLVGSFHVPLLRDFFVQLFSEDHGLRTMSTRVVMLNPEEPSEDLKALLSDPVYATRVQYVKGSTMSFHSLNKVLASRAEAAFILSSRSTSADPNDDDAKSVMRALALRRYNSRLKIFAQILLPANKTHLVELADYILCIDEFIMGMLAQNCLAPGFSTLMYVLTTSIPDSAIKNLGLRDPPRWIREYFSGATMEIYAVQLSPRFAGSPFSSTVMRIYMQYGAVLFGLGFKHGNCHSATNAQDDVDASDDDDEEDDSGGDDIGGKPSQSFSCSSSSHRIVFNPQNYMLKGGETAYLITKHSRVAKRIASGRFNWTPSDSSNSPHVMLDFGIGDAIDPNELNADLSQNHQNNASTSTPFLSPEEVTERVRVYLDRLAASRAREEAMQNEPIYRDMDLDPGIYRDASLVGERFKAAGLTSSGSLSAPVLAPDTGAVAAVITSPLVTAATNGIVKLSDTIESAASNLPFFTPSTQTPNYSLASVDTAGQPGVTASSSDLVDASSVSKAGGSGDATIRSNDTGSRSSKRRAQAATDELIVVRSGAHAGDNAATTEDPPTAEQVLSAVMAHPPQESDVANDDSAQPSASDPSAVGNKERKRGFLSNILRGSTANSLTSGRAIRSAGSPDSTAIPVLETTVPLSSSSSSDAAAAAATKSGANAGGMPSANTLLKTILPRSPPLPSTAPHQQSTRNPAVDTNGIPLSVNAHILVCSLADEFPPNLAYFIAPFRHKDQARAIVILCSASPDEYEWSRLAAFRNVYFVQGTPMKRRDLRCAYVYRASRAVILANPRQQSVVDRAADASTLLAVLNIQAICSGVTVSPELHVQQPQQPSTSVSQQQSQKPPASGAGHASSATSAIPLAANRFSMLFSPDRFVLESTPVAETALTSDTQRPTQRQQESQRPQKVFVMAELVHRENMKFVGSSSASLVSLSKARTGLTTNAGSSDINDIHGQNAIPAFLAGHVFSQSVYHSVLCQTFYNEHLLRVLRMFLFNGMNMDGTSVSAGTSGDRPVPMPANKTMQQSTTNLFVRSDSDTALRRETHVAGGTATHATTTPSMNANQNTAKETKPTKPPATIDDTFGNFFQVVLPSDGRFVGLSYGSLYTYLLVRHNAISLGLYRRTVDRGKSDSQNHHNNNEDTGGLDGAPWPDFSTHGDRNHTRRGSGDRPRSTRSQRQPQIVKYVVVNPAPELLIQQDDAVYLIAAKPPQWDT